MLEPRKWSSCGFTLIELMVTLIVLTILVAMAVPSFATFFEKSRLRAAADDITSLLSSARGGAVKLDRDVAVAFSGDGTAWCVGARAAGNPAPAQPVPGAAPCDCNDDVAACLVDGAVLAVDADQYRGVSLSALPGGFTIDGKLGTLDPLSAETVTLNSTSGRFALELRQSPMGQASLCIPTGKPLFGGFKQC